MCSRYKLAPDPKELGRLLDIDWQLAIGRAWEADRVVRPSELAPVILAGAEPAMLEWGFRRGIDSELKLINARSETAGEKPMFRKAFRKRRLVVPASTYYEWREEWAEIVSEEPAQASLFESPVAQGEPTRQLKKRRYEFTLAGDEPMWFAGIWEPIMGSQTSAAPQGTFAILTTDANALARTIHPRMPCMLGESDVGLWLDPSVQSLEVLNGCLRPIDSVQLNVLADR